MPEWIRLAGIAVILVGLALKLRPAPVVVAAALVTGLAAGLPLLSQPGLEGVLDLLGRAFADNRLLSLFLLTLPVVGLAERHGLQRQAAKLIGGIRGASVGRVLIFYQLFRVLQGVLGIRLSGHPVFVRPLVFPMSKGAAGPGISDAAEERIKAASAASENYGNFYGQNLSPVLPGPLLVYGVLTGLGLRLSLWSLVFYTIPVVVISILLGAFQFLLLDRRWKKL